MSKVIKALRIWFIYLLTSIKIKEEVQVLNQDLFNEFNNMEDSLEHKPIPSIKSLRKIKIGQNLLNWNAKLLESLENYKDRDINIDDISEEKEMRVNERWKDFFTFLNCDIFSAYFYVSRKLKLRYQREIFDFDMYDDVQFSKSGRYTIRSLPYCKFKNTFWIMLSESRMQVDSIIKYFQKTLADIKNSKDEDEISDDLKMIDNEINNYYRVFDNIYKSKTSIKYIKEECLSFISQLFDSKKEIQYKVNEIEKYNQINKILNTSGGKETIRLDFVSNLENIFESKFYA